MSFPTRFPARIVARAYCIFFAPGYTYPGLVPVLDMGLRPVRIVKAHKR